jgi:hypothetical protein
MTALLRTLLLAGGLISLVGCGSAKAHELGLAKATLTEGQNGAYELEVNAPAEAAYMYGLPALPKRCSPMGEPRGQISETGIRFSFRCEGDPITASDELSLPWDRDGLLLTAIWSNGSGAQNFYARDGSSITVDLSLLEVGSGGPVAAAKRYTALGIEHILLGFDHLLFVFALLLIVRGAWMLVKTITAFTVAHSITLALATFGIVNVPARAVEAVIALSIVFVSIEVVNLGRERCGLSARWPWLVAFAFGLLHGFGFASALSELGLPRAEIPTALLFFNIGVEIGQVLFVAAIVSITAVLVGSGVPWRSSGNPRSGLVPARLTLPSAYVVGIIASYWLIARVVGSFA